MGKLLHLFPQRGHFHSEYLNHTCDRDLLNSHFTDEEAKAEGRSLRELAV